MLEWPLRERPVETSAGLHWVVWVQDLEQAIPALGELRSEGVAETDSVENPVFVDPSGFAASSLSVSSRHSGESKADHL